MLYKTTMDSELNNNESWLPEKYGVCSYKPLAQNHHKLISSLVLFHISKATLSNKLINYWLINIGLTAASAHSGFSPLKSHPVRAYLHEFPQKPHRGLHKQEAPTVSVVTNCTSWPLVNRMRAETRWLNIALLHTQLCVCSSNCSPLYIPHKRSQKQRES